MLMDDSDRLYKSTEVRIVLFWKDSIEYTRALAIDIVEKFSSFATTQYLLLHTQMKSGDILQHLQ